MKPLKERFEEKLWNDPSKDLLAFFQQELLALAETAETIRQNDGDNSASEIVDLLRSKAAELN